jgi:hypothetical protein
MTPLLAALLIAALLAFVFWLLSSPFRHGAPAPATDGADSDERRALESAREAKYAEIRDNETDFATGKLSEEDFRALDRVLRSEAMEILRELTAGSPRPASGRPAGTPRVAETDGAGGVLADASQRAAGSPRVAEADRSGGVLADASQRTGAR